MMTSLHGDIRKRDRAAGHQFVTDHSTGSISYTKAIMGRYMLSENTWVDIWPSKYGEGSYLKFICNEHNRTGTFGGHQRWFNLSSKGWKALMILIPEVEVTLRQSGVDGDVTMNLSKKERLSISSWLNKDGGTFYICLYTVNDNGECVQGSGMNLTKEEYKCLIEYASRISIDLSSIVQDWPVPVVPDGVGFPLSKKTYAFAVKGRYAPYLKFVRSIPPRGEEKAKQRWVNVNAATWTAFKSKAHQVQDALILIGESQVDVPIPLEGNARLTVTTFRDKKYVAFLMPDDKEGKRRATRMNFSAVEWFELMERASNIDEVLTRYLVNRDAREEAPLMIDLTMT
jgi:hypothetical protein